MATTLRSMLIDTSKCIGCKACQIACQQWHQLPAEETSFTGSYQNPPDMSSANLTVVKFVDTEIDGNQRFLFMANRCRHCETPTCKIACPLKAIKKTKKGFVYIKDTCTPTKPFPGAVVGVDYCSDDDVKPCQLACPFKNMAETPPLGIPRYLKNNGDPLPDGRANKCDFCYDRWGNATLKADPYLGFFAKSNKPACQVACPTGAIITGRPGGINNKANDRVEYLQANGYPNAHVYPGIPTRVKWILLEDTSLYGEVNGV
jgi:formate dehydrogenase iron-sulfur subunit